MGPLPTKPGVEKGTSTPTEGTFYGVFIPPDTQPSPDDKTTVFVDKSEALKLVKKYKRARFKAFRTLKEATDFADYGAETSNNSWVTSPPQEPINVGEKPSPFKGPKPQDFVRLRKSIENGEFETVKKVVWENPRYLVSSGDTPAILQEGPRYNALHIAAKARDASISAFILSTISSVDFVKRLYGDYSGETEAAEERCHVLLDLYLNTPDKGLNETPLHFATKFGAAKVVQILVAYPQCDKSAKNKFCQIPKDIICDRLPSADASLKEEIASYLEEQFYVPVLRSEDNSIQPVVGQPFSHSSPLEIDNDVTSPVMEVQAVAGPMPKETAVAFRKRWKTPPRIPGSPIIRRPTLVDQVKGWEKVGRELAHEWKVAWKEYWPFLNTYTDFSTDEGLQLLEDYLRKRFRQASSDSSISSSQAVTPTLDKPSVLCEQQNGEVHASSPLSPISELCNSLRACKLNSDVKPQPPRYPVQLPPPNRQPPAQQHVHHNTHNGEISNKCADEMPQHVSPHLYMEKSCQVFAKRIADGLVRNIDSASEFLSSEVQHLISLVSSCRYDFRFSKLDFSLLHARLGHSVAYKLLLNEPQDIAAVKSVLRIIIERKDCFDCSSSEDEEICVTPYSRNTRCSRAKRKVIEQAVICLSETIFVGMEKIGSVTELPPPVSSEETCIELWKQGTKCYCSWTPIKTTRRRFDYEGSVNKRLDFRTEEPDEHPVIDLNSGCKPELEKPKDCCEESSGEESDTSDTGSGEFFTPPSSPTGQRSALSTSEDDLGMESPDEGPDVYMAGNTPSKLDTAVLEAINSQLLSLSKYPNICRWRHLVLLHSSEERERWPCPSDARYRRQEGTPSWHRASILYTSAVVLHSPS